MAKVNTPKFRVAYPNVFKARKNTLNGQDEYSIVALFDKDTDISELKKAAMEAAVEKWGENKAKWPPKMKSPFRPHEDKYKLDDAGNQVLPDGYTAGGIFLTLRSTQKPGVVDQDVQEIIDSSEFYGGCYARASLNAFAYDQAGNRGVSFGLGNIQKLADGTPFGNKTKPQDDFAPVATSVASKGATSAPAGDLFA